MIEALARSFVSLFEAGAPLRQMFDGIVKVVGGVAEVLGAIITIISAVVNGIWDVVAAGAAWINSTTGVGSAVKALWDYTIGGVARVLVWFANLIKATGGIGGAFSALKDVAVEVFKRIGLAFDVIPAAVEAGAQAMKSIFLGAIHDMLANFAWFISSIAQGMNSVFGTSLSEAEPFQETIAGLSDAASSAADASMAASERMSASWAAASAPLESLKALNDKVAEGATAAAASLGGGAGGSGLSEALDGAGKKAKEAKEKLTPLQEVMKRLREELEKLKATAGLTDLQAKIWGDQKEAGVIAASEAGKSIAAMNEQIDALNRTKDAVQRGEDAFRDFFGSILDGVDAAKQALTNLLAEIAKVQFAKGMLGLLGSTSWGSSLIKSVGGLLGENANGTSHWQGGLTRINERGEEIVQLPSGSKVFPAGLSKRMAKGAGGMQAVHVTVGVDPKTGNLTAFVDERAGMAAQSMGRAVSASIKPTIQQYQINPRRNPR